MQWKNEKITVSLFFPDIWLSELPNRAQGQTSSGKVGPDPG